MKMHCGEKPKECNMCDYASSDAGSLRKHLKTHSGEKTHKCYQCDYASSQAGNLKTHLKNTVEKKQTNATNATMHSLMQVL